MSPYISQDKSPGLPEGLSLTISFGRQVSPLTTWQVCELGIITLNRGSSDCRRMAVQPSGSAVIAEDAIVLAQRDKTYRLFKLKKGK